MLVEKLLGFLLPLGVWLILSSAASKSRENRNAVTGLLAFAVSTLVFLAVGFAFMFGGVGQATNLPAFSQLVTYYSIPIDSQLWGIVGLKGYFLADVVEPAAITLFIVYLPLVVTAALLLCNTLTAHTSLIWQGVATLLISGFFVPVLGFWMWGGGWLGALGINLSLGHGAVDIGGLTTISLISAGAATAWLLASPRRQQNTPILLPDHRQPLRAFSGVFALLIGSAAFVSANPLYTFGADAGSSALLSVLLASASAIIVVYAYTIFVARQPDISIATRGALAACIAVACGSIVLPIVVSIALGVLCGVAVIAGLIIAGNYQRWRDETSVLGTLLIPALLGFVATGLFANGAYGQGWNSIGAADYLGVPNLGIVGAAAPGGLPADPGQLSAQLVTAGVVLVVSTVLFLPFALLFPRTDYSLQDNLTTASAEHTATESTSASQPTDLLTAVNAQPLSIRDADVQVIVQINGPDLPVVTDSVATTLAETNPPNLSTPARLSLLDRLRQARKARTEPEAPTQARHVAYPNRIGGRRFAIRTAPKNSQTQVGEESAQQK